MITKFIHGNTPGEKNEVKKGTSKVGDGLKELAKVTMMVTNPA